MRKTAVVLILAVTSAGCAGKGKAPAADPWPECKPARAWLDKHLDDPAGWEVVSWDRRVETAGEPPRRAPRVNVFLTYRARNKRGAWQVVRRYLGVEGGAVVFADEPEPVN